MLLLIALIFTFTMMREWQLQEMGYNVERVYLTKGELVRVAIPTQGFVANESMRIFPNTILKLDGPTRLETVIFQAGKTQLVYTKTDIGPHRSEFHLITNIDSVIVRPGDKVKLNFPREVFFHASKE